MSKYGLGWIPDVPDRRDFKFKAAPEVVAALPAEVDLKSICPKVVYAQNELGSCTAQALARNVQAIGIKEKLKTVIMPSRLMLYYGARHLEGTTRQDAGAQIRNVFKAANRWGYCREKLWPYIIAKFKTQPPRECYLEGKKRLLVNYSRVEQDPNQIKACLADGYPFVGGVSVYGSFFDAPDGNVQMPGGSERLQGGHAVLFTGYSDSNSRYIFDNSWSISWGNKGRGTIPYNYLHDPDLAADFWVVKLVPA